MTTFRRSHGGYRVAGVTIGVTYWRLFFSLSLSLSIRRDFVPHREGEDSVASQEPEDGFKATSCKKKLV